MGAGPSKTEEQISKAKEEVYVENIKNFLGTGVDTTLRMEDLETDAPKVGGSKPVLPKLSDLYGGSVRSSNRNRYAQYDVFDELAQLEAEEQQEQTGGAGEEIKPTDMKDISSDEAMKQVKETIINHLNSLKAKQAQTAGSCGCDSNLNKKTGGSSHLLVAGPQRKLYRDDSDTSTTTSSSSESTESSHTSSSEVGKRKSKAKAKGKGKNKAVEESSSINFVIDTTESGAEVEVIEEEVKPRRGRTSRRRRIETSNEDDSSSSSESADENDDEEEGLSIFPFNSSDVKSSVSSQNFKTLRRRI
jgi:hypothetical protein